VELELIPTELVIAHPESERQTHYQIAGILGEGGSGTTYRALIVGTDRFVALKQLSLAQMDDWKAIDLFEREAQILSQLNHPAIPKYIDYFTLDTPTDRHFYTVVGTFGYMAPEQFRSQALPATDLYGLGATILALLTNRSPAELTQSNLKLSFRNKIQVSPAFADWLEKMLEPDPTDRFDSATTALAALKNPKSLNPKLPWRKFAAVGLAAMIGLGTLDYYKYYFLNLWGFTPVEAFSAIWQHHDVNKVRYLLDRGVSPNAKDASGSTLIHYAVTNNQVEIAKLSIDRGADIHAHYGMDGHTVLHLAVLHQDGEMTKLLLDRKADPNARDNFKLTPLHIVMLRKNAPYQPLIDSYYGMGTVTNYDNDLSAISVEYLLSYGADVNAISDLQVPSSLSYSYKVFGTPLNATSMDSARNNINTIMMLIKAGGKRLECDPLGKQCELSDSRDRMVRNYSCDDKKCVVVSRQKLRSINDMKKRRFK
jgi:hypothetical protein